MIDDKFSLKAFLRCGLDTEAANSLAKSLAEEIYKEVHVNLRAYLSEVVMRLNAMGHNLKVESDFPGDDSYPGDISYRDDWNDETGYHCKLRVAINTVVSTGFAHMYSEEEEEELISGCGKSFVSNEVTKSK